MARKRVILELGMGNDLHGGDYTKAALRAVQDAIHHSSLSMIRSLGIDPKTQIFVEVTVGVQQPERVRYRGGEGVLAAWDRYCEGGQGRVGRDRPGARR